MVLNKFFYYIFLYQRVFGCGLGEIVFITVVNILPTDK